MSNLKYFVIFLCSLNHFIYSQFNSRGSYPHFYNLPSIATSYHQPEENSVLNDKDVMETNMMENKLDIKTEILLKISLAILVFKALAFNMVLFALIVIIPLLNPEFH